MKKNIVRIVGTVLVLALSVVLLMSCTEQQRARQFGGNANMDLPKGQKLVLVTWKEDNLWYMTRPMTEADQAESYSFKESSSYGLTEGTVTIREHK